MGWRYRLGATMGRAKHAFLTRAPAIRGVPHGNWLYDIRRVVGRRAGNIFDVGANIGQTAWGLTKYFPSDPIFCFEPVEEPFTILQKRFGDRVTCVKAALGASPGSAEINLSSNSELNTFCEPGALAREQATGRTERVTIETLDGFCRNAGIGGIGILKMDVQGWEMEVLKGGRDLLERRAIKFIMAEVGFISADTDMQSFCELSEFLLEGHGYRFCGLYDQFRWGPVKQYVSFANALFVLQEDRAAR